METNSEEQAEPGLAKKQVIKLLSVYAVTGWLLTQVATTIAPYFDLPTWTVKMLIIVIVSGFPMALLYAFLYKPGQSRTRSLALFSFSLIIAGGLSGIIFWSTSSLGSSNIKEVKIAPAISDKSIAVLPFVDLSQTKDQEYFSDGLSEELLNTLAKIRELKVIARTSSFYFKGKNEDMRVIGKKLGVAHLLEGSVQKSGNKLRITAQLIKAEDGTHLWSETYDRTLDDIFLVEDEIASAVVAQLSVALLKRAAVATLSPAAYNLYLEGKYFTNKRDKESSALAIEKYKQALEINPKLATAWVGLAITYTYQATYGYMPEETGYTKGREAAQKALLIDPNLSEAYAMQSRIYSVYDWDWTKADASIKKALELGSGNALTLSNAGILSMHLGRFDEAISFFKKSIAVDPLRAATFYSLGLAFYFAGKLEEAATQFTKTIELNSTFASAHYQLARTLLLQGQNALALEAIMKEHDESWKADGIPLVYYKLNRKEESEVVLKEVIAKYSDDSAYQIAEIYAYRGEMELAFQWLERAYKQRDAGLANVRVEPMLKNLHQDTRWIPFLKKMKLA